MELRKTVRDRIKMRDGEWIALGAEYGKVEVLVRAMAGAYVDDLGARRRDLYREFNGAEQVPTDRENQAQTEALIARVLVDVKGGPDDTIDGAPVSLENFTALLREPGATALVNAVIVAASKVGLARDAERKAAAGN